MSTVAQCGWWEVLPIRRSVPFVGWVGFTEVAIAASFLIPTWIAVNALANGWNPVLRFTVICLAGAAQGFLIAFVQWAFLARARVAPQLLAWVGLSSIGAASAWALGQLPTFLPRTASASMATLLTLASIACALSLPILGQWLALRSVSTRAHFYAVVSYVAWLVGASIMAATLGVLTAVTDLTATIVLLIFGAYAGVAAVSVGTWFATRRLTQKDGKKSAAAKKKPPVKKVGSPTKTGQKKK